MSRELDADELLNRDNESTGVNIMVLQAVMLVLGYGVWEWPWFVTWFPAIAFLVVVLLALLLVFGLVFITQLTK